jgi:hypothetical protein
MTPKEMLSAVLEQKEDQDRRMADAWERLAASGRCVLTVPRAWLEAMAEACLVPDETLNTDAIRG